jgi:outer membrane protein
MQTLLSQERSTAQQTRDAYRGVTGSISRANALRQALISTRKSAEATDAGFRAGTRTSVEVLRALRDVYRAESDFAGARYDYLINYLSLKAAAGTLNAADLTPINNFLVSSAEK